GRVRRSPLHLLGPGLTVLTMSTDRAWQAAAASAEVTVPIDVVQLDALVARSLGIRPGGAILVRPDGVPIAQWGNDLDAVIQLRGAVTAFAGRSAGPPDLREAAA